MSITNWVTSTTRGQRWLHFAPAFFMRPVEIARDYRREDLWPDLLAGLTVAVVLVPQSIAFALIAGLPPETGLYAAIVAAIVAALWGSSSHQHSGPTNAISLLAGASLAAVVAPDAPNFVAAAGLLAVMVGVAQLLMGVARLGVLVNFVSDSVVIGFTTGAAILIAISELKHLLRVTIPFSFKSYITALETLRHIGDTHLLSLALGLGTMAVILLVKRFRPRWPGTFIGMLMVSVLVAGLKLNEQGVIVLGELPRALPPLADLPFDLALVGQLSTGALAVASISLVATISIARSIAAQTGQRIDGNQEFVGQGLANIAVGFFSGYTVAGSFSRSALNHAAGARTSLASVFSSLWMLLIVLLFAPLARYLPRTALAGVLIVTAYNMVDRREIRRVWRASKGDSLILIATFLGTLLLPLEFAVLAGMLVSFGRYLARTSMPVVRNQLPDDDFKYLVHRPEKPACPQLAVVEIRGALYFGAVQHVEDAIHANLARNPTQRFLLLRMHRVVHCDMSGIHMLESVVRAYRQKNGDVFVVGVNEEVMKRMQLAGFDALLGADHFLGRGTGALSYLFYRVLDPAVCIYECEARAWEECQNLPKRTLPRDVVVHTELPTVAVQEVSPKALWQKLRSKNPPRVVDVREPREFQKGHIPEAELLPLPRLLANPNSIMRDGDVVFVCRSGRRSARAASYATGKGSDNVCILRGGMLAWEAAGLLEAIN